MDGQLVKYGGVTVGSVASNVSFFDGWRWTQGGPFGLTQPRAFAGCAESLSGVVIAGGDGTLGALNDTRFRAALDPLDAGFVSGPTTFLGAQRLVYEPNRDAFYSYNVNGAQWLTFDGGIAPTGFTLTPQLAAFDRRGYLVGLLTGGNVGTLAATDSDWQPMTFALSDAVLDLGTEPVTGDVLAVTTDGRVFRWQTTGWESVSLSDPFVNSVPAQRTLSMLASSTALKALFLSGGLVAGVRVSDLWELKLVGNQSAAMLQVDLSATHFPDATQVSSIAVHAIAGGDADVAGATVQVWTAWGWQTVVTNTAAAGAPQPLDGTLTGVDAQRLMTHAAQLGVRAVTTGSSGLTPATLNLDVLELTVHAHLE